MKFLFAAVQDLLSKLPDNLFVLPVLLIAGLVLFFVSNYLIRRFERIQDNITIKTLRTQLKTPVLVIIIIIALISAITAFESTHLEYRVLKHITTLSLIGCIAWVFIRFIKAVRFIVLSKYNIKEKNNLKARKITTQFRILERVLIFIVVVITIAISLMTFEKIQKIGVSLFASAGIAGIIIGFAAQKALATVLAGFQLAITQPIRLEDVVIVENEWGWIEEITLTYVVIRIWDKRRLIVPTTYFIEKPFQNWTRVSADLLGTVYLYTDYRVPFDELRAELTRLLEGSELWDGKVNVLQVTNATAATVEVRALMSTVDSPTGWDLRVYVREKLIQFIREKYPESLPRTRVEMLQENS
jgi:small-conductance mechanosensitive channel